jgi:NADH-quinone oxidoreductase subunit G
LDNEIGASALGSVFIDDKEIDVDPKSNLIQAAREAGVEVPYYCWHHDLSVVASCRMCLVEVGEKKPDGSVAMLPKLVPACQTPAKPGTVVRTNTDKVKASREQTLEYLLLNHPLDCSICDQAGECYLQDYTYKFGRAHSRLNEPKVQRLDKYHIGDQIALFTDRCVMCTRCVRFTREISGTAELHVINRGSVEEIDVRPGHPCNNKLAGNVVDICPVGALCSKDFLYKKRVWWLKHADSVCTGCSTGCSIIVDQNEDKLYRIRPRENPQAQGSFMCDEGRFGWKHLQGEGRLTAPRAGRLAIAAATVVGSHAEGSSLSRSESRALPQSDADFQDAWGGIAGGGAAGSGILGEVRSAIASMAKQEGRRFVAILSPFMTCEEAYLLCDYLRGLSKHITLAMGEVPIVGEDDLYPKGPRGEAPTADNVKFTIRAEKCPNRLGVEAVLKRFQGEVIPFDVVLKSLASGAFDGAYYVGGYPPSEIPSGVVRAFEGLKLLIVQDLMQTPLSDLADYVLASASFAERQGTVINHKGLAQSYRVAVRPPGEARADGRILMELSGRKGLFHSPTILKEIATEIPALSKFGKEEVGTQGLMVTA